MVRSWLIVWVICTTFSLWGERVKLGIDRFFEEGLERPLVGKRLGLIAHDAGINGEYRTTLDLFLAREELTVTAVFAPEHGYHGVAYASESVPHQQIRGIPLFSLHGQTRRPTAKMLEQVDVLLFDIQDVGSRSYTYISTLFYCMEEAAKNGIPLFVLDRPNPLGGEVVDGLLLEPKFRSFVGYVDVPYCHGMTIGELARFFNEEYQIGCALTVVPMEGWRRSMQFEETGLAWMPTSPHIPEATTPLYYPVTGILGELGLVNTGVGYTLPFKLIGAPWIDAELLAAELNAQRLPGVLFQPFYFKPFFGAYKNTPCNGVHVCLTDPHRYLPVTTQYTLLGVLKNLYPSEMKKALADASASRREMFNKVNGTDAVWRALVGEKPFMWGLREQCQQDRQAFLLRRKKYLLYS